MLEYKSDGGIADRDLLPEDYIYLTFNFRNVGDFRYKPKAITKDLNKSLNN